MIIATGAGSEEIAVRAMKLGAADYINKETYDKFFHLLPSVIEKALRQHELERQKQRAETELRESEERLRSILASIDDAVLVTDKAGLFVPCAPPGSGTRRRHGFGAPWIGATFRDVFPPAVAAHLRGGLRRGAGHRPGRAVRLLASPLEGGEVWFNAKVSPLKDVQRGFAGCHHRGARHHRAQAAEDQLCGWPSLAADAASRAKSDLLAGHVPRAAHAAHGHHRVRGDPFQRILRPGERAAEAAARHHPAGSRHLLDLINDILDISKIESGKTELELGSVRMSALVTHTLVLLKETASRAEDPACAPRLPAELDALQIPADERRVKQVLFNLLSNALKFTPDGGRVEIALRAEEDSLAVSVTDTGIGIPRGRAGQDLRRLLPDQGPSFDDPRRPARAWGSPWPARSWSCTAAESGRRARAKEREPASRSPFPWVTPHAGRRQGCLRAILKGRERPSGNHCRPAARQSRRRNGSP